MLHEFAVDPECMATLDALRRITDHCALHLGRFVSDFARRRWESVVWETLKPQLTFRAEQQLTEVLAQLQRRGGLINTGRRFQRGISWIDNALQQHGEKPFRAIVAGVNPTQEGCVLLVDDVTPEADHWRVQTEVRVARTSADLSACVRPLLHLSSEVLFVDPHFAPDTSRYQESLEAFLAAACEGGRRYTRLEYHTKIRGKFEDDVARTNWIDTFRGDCRNQLPRRVPNGIPLRVVLWNEKPDGDEMHARYVMTERGAIRIEKGLDIGHPNQTTDISLVAPGVYRQRWNDLQRDATTYEFVEEVEIVGTRHC